MSVCEDATCSWTWHTVYCKGQKLQKLRVDGLETSEKMPGQEKARTSETDVIKDRVGVTVAFSYITHTVSNMFYYFILTKIIKNTEKEF